MNILLRFEIERKLTQKKLFFGPKSVFLLFFFGGIFEIPKLNFFVIFGFPSKQIFFWHWNTLCLHEKILGSIVPVPLQTKSQKVHHSERVSVCGWGGNLNTGFGRVVPLLTKGITSDTLVPSFCKKREKFFFHNFYYTKLPPKNTNLRFSGT